MGAVVLLQFGVRNRGPQVRRQLRTKCYEGDRGRIVPVPPDLPKPRVGDVHVAGELCEELLLRDLRAVVPFELRQQSLLFCGGAGQKTLVLRRVELAVRLELWRLSELRGRRVLGRLNDLGVCDPDPPLLVFLVEESLGDELVERLLVDLATLVERQRVAALLLFLLRQGCGRILIRYVRNLVAIHFRHHGRCGDGRSAEQAGRFRKQKAADEGDEHDDPDVLRGAPHLLQHGAGLPVRIRRCSVVWQSLENYASTAAIIKGQS